MTAEQYDYQQRHEYEPSSSELGNCPNCGEIVVRELMYRGNVYGSCLPEYYWPCATCGYTHHGADIPALD